MPDTAGPMLMSPNALVDSASAILEAHGSARDDAIVQARHLVEGELRGHPSHGLRRLEALVARIRNGLLDPVAEPRLAWEADAVLRVDGARGFGPVAAHRAIDAILERLPRTGAAVASLRRTHHLGMLAPYVERLAEAGCIGLVLSSTEGLVHPWGGAGSLIGTNPLGIGIPTGSDPLSLDMSTAEVSAGKILDYRAKGLPLPEGWAVDERGESTTDAEAAVRGAISPFGGAKGYALGLALGTMVGALTDTAFGDEVHGTLDAEHETSKGDLIIAMDVRRLAGSDPGDRIDAYLDRVRRSGPATTVPGDRARSARTRALREGIELSSDVREMLDRLEQETTR